MRKGGRINAAMTAYALLVTLMYWGGFVRDFIVYPFLLIPLLMSQVYWLFSCPRRNAHRDRIFHLAGVLVIGLATALLFYLSARI